MHCFFVLDISVSFAVNSVKKKISYTYWFDSFELLTAAGFFVWILSSGYCLWSFAGSPHLFMCFLLCFSATFQKHIGSWPGYSKLLVGVNDGVTSRPTDAFTTYFQDWLWIQMKRNDWMSESSNEWTKIGLIFLLFPVISQSENLKPKSKLAANPKFYIKFHLD